MPDIKLGSSENMKNINLGSKELQAVKKGTVVVWLNNLAPQIELTSPRVGVYGDDDFPISVVFATAKTIVFQAIDIDPGDKVASFSVTGPPGFTPVPTTPISPPSNPATGLSFTIPATLFPTIGIPTTNNVFTITVADQKGRDDDYTVTVTNVTVVGPTARVDRGFQSVDAYSPSSYTRSAVFSMTQSPSAIAGGYTPEYSDDGGATFQTYFSPITLYATSTCGNSASAGIQTRSVSSIHAASNGSSASSTFSVSSPDIIIQGGSSGLPSGLRRYQVSELYILTDCDANTNSWGIRESSRNGSGSPLLPIGSGGLRYYWTENPAASVSIGSTVGTLTFLPSSISVNVREYYFLPPVPNPPSAPPPLTFSGVSYGVASLSQIGTETFEVNVGDGSVISASPVTVNRSTASGPISNIGGNLGSFNGSPAIKSFDGTFFTVSFSTSGWAVGTYSYRLAAQWGFTSNGNSTTGVNFFGTLIVTVTDPNAVIPDPEPPE